LTNPSSNLHVFTNSLGGTSTNTSEIAKFGGDSNGMGALRMYGYRVSNGSDWTTSDIRLQRIVDATQMGYISFTGGTVQGELAFGISGGSTEVMRINSSGNVGISNVNPQYKLTVQDTQDQIFLQTGNNNYGAIMSAKDEGSGVVPFQIKTMRGDTVTTRLTINNDNGNVGIGSTQPSQMLDVVGRGAFSNGIHIPGYAAETNAGVTFDGSSWYTITSFNTDFGAGAGLYLLMINWGNETNTTYYWYGEAVGITFINSSQNANFSAEPGNTLYLNQRYHQRTQGAFEFRTAPGPSGTGGNSLGYGPQTIQVKAPVATNTIYFNVYLYHMG
jgi:hypothetical protein